MILKSSEYQLDVKVIDFVLHDAVAKGHNFFSYLMRATVNYTEENGFATKQKKFVIKTSLESEEMNKKLKKFGLFDKEIAFYRAIEPEFRKYTDFIDKSFKCAPRYFAANDHLTYIVLEDLPAQNYRTMDRRIGLDFEATSMVVRKLAKMHAINAMIYEERPQLFEPHKVRLLSSDNPELITVFTSGMRDTQQMCLKWPGYEHFYDKFQYWLNNSGKLIELLYRKDGSTFNTLTHGDLWINNIMYQFDETNTPVDVLLIDYQIGYYGSPALDLTYLFYTSTAANLCEQHWDRLLQMYHRELVNCLKLVRYSKHIPTLTELQIQMLKNSLRSAIMSLSIVPPRYMDDKIEADIDIIMTDSDKKLKTRYAVYEKPMVYQRLQYLLDYYNRKGIFDIMQYSMINCIY